jgi:hypothetical protein
MDIFTVSAWQAYLALDMNVAPLLHDVLVPDHIVHALRHLDLVG